MCHSFLRFPFSAVPLFVLDCSKSMLLLISCLFSFAFLVWSMQVKVSANPFSSLQPWSYRGGYSEYPFGCWALKQMFKVSHFSFCTFLLNKSLHHLFSCSHCVVPLSCSLSVRLTAWLEKSRAGNSFHLFLQFDESKYE